MILMFNAIKNSLMYGMLYWGTYLTNFNRESRISNILLCRTGVPLDGVGIIVIINYKL